MPEKTHYYKICHYEDFDAILYVNRDLTPNIHNYVYAKIESPVDIIVPTIGSYIGELLKA